MKKVFALLLAVVLVVFATVPAFATDLKSPSGDQEYDVNINNNQGGTGSYTTEYVEDGEYTIITADPNDGYNFSYWVINGDYELIEGSLTDLSIKIRPLSDIVVTPYFEKDGKIVEGPDGDDSGTSPKTSDATTYVFATIALLSVALFGAVVTKKVTSK